ncbi:MAG: metallophosphoesterase [Clostridia bacterium]|nr:metallophosphoesterase [Clostridia bacterium]
MIKRMWTLLLSGIMLLTGIPLFAGCSGHSPLRYSLYFNEAGRGGGVITVNSPDLADGVYWLYWGQDAKTNLDNYIYLSAIEVTEGVGKVALNKHLLIPKGATHLLLRDSEKNQVLCSVIIPKANRYDAAEMELGEVEYTFATISDQHAVVKHSVTGEIVYSADYIRRILEHAKNFPNFKFIGDTGDLADLPYLEGLEGYNNDVNKIYENAGISREEIPLLIGVGNHETRGKQIENKPFATLLDSLKIMEDPRFTALYGDHWADNGEGGKVFSYRVYPIPDTNDYAFFFSTWAVMYNDAFALASEALINLSRDPNTGKIFVYQHMPVYGEAGSSLKLLDKEPTEADASWAGMSSAYDNQQQWVNLISTMQNVIVFNGHSHQNYNLAYADNHFIASDGEGTLARQLYTPALWSRTDDIKVMEGIYEEPPSSLGRYQEVYEKAVISYAVDYNKYNEGAEWDHVTYQPVACLYVPYNEDSAVADVELAEGVETIVEATAESPVNLSLVLRDINGEQISDTISYRITDSHYATVKKSVAHIENSHLHFASSAPKGDYHVIAEIGNLSVLFNITYK